MIVVSDSSPLILLDKIDCLFILPHIFGTVVIPEEVEAELRTDASSSHGHKQFVFPDWLVIKHCQNPVRAKSIDLGESAAIGLAMELGASLLIDDKRGRAMAKKVGLSFLGSVGALELAANERLIELCDAFERIKQTDFRISHDFLDERLALYSQSAAEGNSP